jgi:hypothetical protein
MILGIFKIMLRIVEDLETCGYSKELITEKNIILLIKRNMTEVSSGGLNERKFDLAATLVETRKDWKC